MTNRARVLELIRSRPGLTDAQIRRNTGIEPHQQVNQICRELERVGLVARHVGSDGLIVNLPAGVAEAEPARTEGVHQRDTVLDRLAMSAEASGSIPAIELAKALVVLPCSGRKAAPSGQPAVGESVLDYLPRDLAGELKLARLRSAVSAHLDDSLMGPALDVYDGTLYQPGRAAIRSHTADGTTIAIISGGYGVVLGSEPIGLYNQTFRASMWPRRLVGRCLAALASTRCVAHVVGLLAATSPYADVFRTAPWRSELTSVRLATPMRTTGAMVKAPRALGEALAALAATGSLSNEWHSSDGLAMEVEGVPHTG